MDWTQAQYDRIAHLLPQRVSDDAPTVPTPSMSNHDLAAARKKYNMPLAGMNGIADVGEK